MFLFIVLTELNVKKKKVLAYEQNGIKLIDSTVNSSLFGTFSFEYVASLIQ